MFPAKLDIPSFNSWLKPKSNLSGAGLSSSTLTLGLSVLLSSSTLNFFPECCSNYFNERFGEKVIGEVC